MKMFKKKCDGPNCEKIVSVWGKSKDGTLPTAYCGKVCEANAKYEKRFDSRFK